MFSHAHRVLRTIFAKKTSKLWPIDKLMFLFQHQRCLYPERLCDIKMKITKSKRIDVSLDFKKISLHAASCFLPPTYGQKHRDLRGLASGHCWLLKLRWIGTQRVQMKWKGSRFGLFVGLVVPVQETFVLPWLLWSAQYKKIWYCDKM
jgi:hypothetical protein